MAAIISTSSAIDINEPVNLEDSLSIISLKPAANSIFFKLSSIALLKSKRLIARLTSALPTEVKPFITSSNISLPSCSALLEIPLVKVCPPTLICISCCLILEPLLAKKAPKLLARVCAPIISSTTLFKFFADSARGTSSPPFSPYPDIPPLCRLTVPPLYLVLANKLPIKPPKRPPKIPPIGPNAQPKAEPKAVPATAVATNPPR